METEEKSINQENITMPSDLDIDVPNHKFPFCIVWTPLPLISALIPVIGHMGISTSRGVIRDFAGPYHVSEDNMAFGWPTKYLQLKPEKVFKGIQGWDDGVHEASEIYKHRMHNLFCDNCHSHVATAMNLMQYDGSTSWNMVKLAFLITFQGRYVGIQGFLRTWVPFCILIFVILFYRYVLR